MRVNPFRQPLALTATRVQGVLRILSWKGECSSTTRPSCETVAFGHAPDDQVAERFRPAPPPLGRGRDDCRALDLRSTKPATPPRRVATEDLDLGFMKIAKGHVAGLATMARYRERVEVTARQPGADDRRVEPNCHPPRCISRSTANPNLKSMIGAPPKGKSSELLMGLAMLMTAMPTVHAIPHVVAAPPGVVTYKDLPLITAVGCIRT